MAEPLLQGRLRLWVNPDLPTLGQNRLGLTGPIEKRQGKSAQLQPQDWRLTLGWQVASELKKRVNDRAHERGLVVEHQRSKSPAINVVRDTLSGRADVYTPGGMLELSGVFLKFDVQKKDEGIFLKSHGQSEEVRLQRYRVVYPQRVEVLLPKKLSGQQQLVLRRRLRPSNKNPSEALYDTILTPA